MRLRDWSIAKLSEESGISRQTIYNIKKGNGDVSTSTLKQLAKALKVPVVRFFI